MTRRVPRRRDGSDRTLAATFRRNAAGFHQGAEAVLTPHPEGGRYFLAIAIELALKAYLLDRGISDDWNRVYLRHDLVKALRYARRAGFSASKLYEIAKTLQVPVSYFFDGLADPVTDESDDVGEAANRVITDFLNTPEGLELAAIFPKVGKGRVRRQILDLVRAMADDEGQQKSS